MREEYSNFHLEIKLSKDKMREKNNAYRCVLMNNKLRQGMRADCRMMKDLRLILSEKINLNEYFSD